MTPSEHVAAVVESPGRLGGKALCVTFDGAQNTDYRGAAERLVLPDGRYRLRAWLRTGGVTTNEGVFLEVVDAFLGQQLWMSEKLTGTRGWSLLEGSFQVSGGTRLAELRLRRQPSMKFDNKVQGAVWLDDVSVARQ